MAGYVKLFGSILDSTIWSESLPTKVTWITMLAMSDQDGIVTAPAAGLAKRAGVSRDECDAALALFLAPDPDSKTTDNEGRRIERVDGGWRLLNHAKYREIQSAEDRKIKTAERQQRWRDRHSGAKPPHSVTPAVTLSNAHNGPSHEVTPVTPSDQISSALSSSLLGSLPPDQTHAESNVGAKEHRWSAYEWQKAYGRAWMDRYETICVGRGTVNAKATADLGDMLLDLDDISALNAQRRSAEMFAIFLATPDRREAKHPWAWFVIAFPGLLVARRTPSADLTVGHARAQVKPRPEGVVKL